MAMSPTFCFSPAIWNFAHIYIYILVVRKVIRHWVTLLTSYCGTSFLINLHSFSVPLYLELGMPKPLFLALLLLLSPKLSTLATRMQHIGGLDSAGKHIHARTHRTPSDPLFFFVFFVQKEEEGCC